MLTASRYLPLFFLAALVVLLEAAGAQQLLWENQGLTDEASVASGSTFLYNGAIVTVTWSVTTDGGFGTYAGGSGSTGGGNDYVSYEASQEGAHTGLLLLSFDNSSYDKDDYITLTVSFSQPQSALAFSLLDIDSVDEAWDDLVDMTYNGSNNVRANTSLWSYAASSTVRTVVEDNENNFTGWEGRPDSNPAGSFDWRADPNENIGNVDINFTGIAISNFTITFRSTDDFTGDPGGQKIGFSDFYITTIPEPASFSGAAIILALIGGNALFARRRRAPISA